MRVIYPNLNLRDNLLIFNKMFTSRIISNQLQKATN